MPGIQEDLRQAESELYDMERFGPDEDCPSMATFRRMLNAKWQFVENLRKAVEGEES